MGFKGERKRRGQKGRNFLLVKRQTAKHIPSCTLNFEF